MEPYKTEVDAANGLFDAYTKLKTEISKVIIGQDDVVKLVLTSIFCQGHSLLVGVPGLAKTLLIHTVASALNLKFNRIQFTPDLMPSDILGSETLDKDRNFQFIKGPIFANIVLADEINRTPPKTQAALLESMQEYKVTIAGHDYELEKPFFVLATQNPIEQEGTYPLPEAQLDRFLMHVSIGYPDAKAEQDILELARGQARDELGNKPEPKMLVTQQQVFEAQRQVLDLHMAPALQEYIVQLVLATRDPGKWDEQLGRLVSYGASPRATIGLDRCARARAWLDGRDFVSPDDIHAVIHEVTRHRVLLSYEAEADGVIVDELVNRLLDLVPVP